MAKGWTKNRPCPICGGAGWGRGKCRGFEHRDGSAVYCEWPEEHKLHSDHTYIQSTTVIAPFGIPLTCFRKVLG